MLTGLNGTIAVRPGEYELWVGEHVHGGAPVSIRVSLTGAAVTVFEWSANEEEEQPAAPVPPRTYSTQVT